MRKLSVNVPKALDLHESLAFSISLFQIASGSDVIELDFEHTTRVEPLGMLLVSSEIARLRKRFPGIEIRYKNASNMVHASEMGFFYALGVDHGIPVVKPHSEAIPIQIFDCELIVKNAAKKGVEPGDEVEEQSRQMAAILCQEDHGDVYDTLSYSIREIMRNVIEHSQSTRFGICAQHWRAQNKVEVAILDRGIGLKKSLSINPHVDASNDQRAINYALMPAVSGKAFKGTRIKQSGPWANSGFGLYMTNRICRNGGNFFIATGDVGMLLTKGEGKKYFKCHLDGTVVRLVIKTDQLDSLKNSLAKFRQEGFEIQKRYREIVQIDPSSASLMLSDDFDLSTWDRLLLKLKNI